MAAVDQVVYLRYQVGQRTADGQAVDGLSGMAERHTAVHAARGLLAKLLGGLQGVELGEVLDPLGYRAVGGIDTLEFQKAGWFAHRCS